MEIQRIIGGKPYTIELSDEEMYQAYLEKDREFTIGKVFQYLDHVESVGGIPSELLQSERFADKVMTQLDEMQDNYEVNISKAITAAVEYEIKSETVEDLVSASTADLIVDRLNQAGYVLGANSTRLAAELKKSPSNIIHSIKEAPAANAVSGRQSETLNSCVSLVKKYQTCCYIGRGINELEDYDDLDPEKDLKKQQQAERPLRQGLSRTRERKRW
jgi:hypothetical protein